MKMKEESATTMETKSVEATRSTTTCCCLVTKLMRKLKKSRSRIRQGSFQCHYDPLSYSLNFDTSDCGSLLDEDYYYKFCAFSSSLGELSLENWLMSEKISRLREIASFSYIGM
ncbi:hypothetical protein TSUD_66590 [Trifolium subterraneum]|uniref:Uncharacterized protein n=1 Tax=Trifolium subterraneum TaxID=3900 RepID=A0A2Z6NAQ1_TRISU|nr:hypothetical protein TSUD_66590 [Trifolium subterraneum]